MSKNYTSLSAYLDWENDEDLLTPAKDYFYALRVRLLKKGYISSIYQRTVKGEDAIRECFAWYAEEIQRQIEAGSTDRIGKLFEVGTRMLYAIKRCRPWHIADTKCRPSCLSDMILRVESANVRAELKVNRGALGYGVDEATAKAQIAKKLRQNPVFVWFYEGFDFQIDTLDDIECANPLCVRLRDMLEHLERPENSKGKGISYWLVTSGGVRKADGTMHQCTINLKAPDPKKEGNDFRSGILDSLRAEGMDWMRLVENAEFGEE